jgi:hypothetical protein
LTWTSPQTGRLRALGPEILWRAYNNYLGGDRVSALARDLGVSGTELQTAFKRAGYVPGTEFSPNAAKEALKAAGLPVSTWYGVLAWALEQGLTAPVAEAALQRSGWLKPMPWGKRTNAHTRATRKRNVLDVVL